MMVLKIYLKVNSNLRKLCFFWVKRVPGRGQEQRESEKTVLYPQIIIILISYIIIIELLINENHPGGNWKQNS
jgi:hypothetical protein